MLPDGNYLGNPNRFSFNNFTIYRGGAATFLFFSAREKSLRGAGFGCTTFSTL